MSLKSKSQVLSDPEKPLKHEHLAVIDRYFENGFNQREAMEHCNYSVDYARKYSHMIFSRAEVRKEIKRRMEYQAKNFEVGVDLLLERMYTLATANLGEIVLKLQENEWDLSCLTGHEKYALSEISIEETEYGRGDDRVPMRKVKIKTRDVKSALETLFKHKGLLTERLELLGAGDQEEAVAQARARMRKGK